MIISGSLDTTLRIWKLLSGENVYCLFADEPIITLELDLQGNILVAGGANGGVYFLSLQNLIKA